MKARKMVWLSYVASAPGLVVITALGYTFATIGMKLLLQDVAVAVTS